jgi:hypothetical protein
VGHKFSLVLSREITDAESVALKDAGCAGAVFATDSLPTNAEVAVTRLEFDDPASASLAVAIESALAAVRTVPDLTVPGLTVPAQPVRSGESVVELAEPVTVQDVEIVDATEPEPKAIAKPAVKRAVTKKPAAKKAAVKTAVKKKVGVN